MTPNIHSKKSRNLDDSFIYLFIRSFIHSFFLSFIPWLSNDAVPALDS